MSHKAIWIQKIKFSSLYKVKHNTFTGHWHQHLTEAGLTAEQIWRVMKRTIGELWSWWYFAVANTDGKPTVNYLDVRCRRLHNYKHNFSGILRENANHVTDVQDGARGGPAVDQLGLCVQHPRAVASDTLQKQPEGADSYCQKQEYFNEGIYIRGKILSSVCTVHSNLVDNSR